MGNKRIIFRLETERDTPETIIHNQRSRKHRTLVKEITHSKAYHDTRVTWALSRQTENKEFVSYFRYMPVDSLSDNVTEQAVLASLNMPRAFQWDYTPQAGDSLFIHWEYVMKEVRLAPRAHLNKYMSFIFTGHSWNASVIHDEYEMILIGVGVIDFE